MPALRSATASRVRSLRPRTSPLQSPCGTSRPPATGGTRFVPARAGSARPSIEHGPSVAPAGRARSVGCQSHTPAGSPPWARRGCSKLLTPSAPRSHGAPNASGCPHRIVVGRPAEVECRAPTLAPGTPRLRASRSARAARIASVETVAVAALAVWPGRACRVPPRLIVCSVPIRHDLPGEAIVWQSPSQRRCAVRCFPSRKHNACWWGRTGALSVAWCGRRTGARPVGAF